jgi:hypothetical protein
MSGHIRSELRLVFAIMSWIIGPILVLGPGIFGIWALSRVGVEVWSALFVLFLCLGGGLIASHMAENYQWVEFDGTWIRGRKLWSRRLVERSLAEVRDVRVVKGAVTDPVSLGVDAILGSARGWEIRFHQGPSVFLVRYDMTNAWDLAVAVANSVRERQSESSAADSGTAPAGHGPLG